jgi:sensor histidine kinase YesM
VKDLNESRNKAIVQISKLTLVFLIASSVANAFNGRYSFVIVYFLAFIITSIHLYLYNKNHQREIAAQTLVVILFIMFFSFFFIGEHASFDILWVLVLPIVTIILGDYKETKFWLISFNILLLAALILQALYPLLIPYESFALWSMLWAGIFLSGMALYYKQVQGQLLSEIKSYQEGLEGEISNATNEIKTLQTEKQQSEYLLMQSRLSSLETQLNPHFLFNALNSIAELIHIDSHKAEEAVLKVSSFLRNTMEEKALMSLSKELKNVKEYVELENIRFNGKINLSVEDNIPYWQVPKFSIQLIIENAIKHGVDPKKPFINISIGFNHSENIISIENDGRPITSSNFGIGLNNLNQRLQLLCDGWVEIRQTHRPCFEIHIGKCNENTDS